MAGAVASLTLAETQLRDRMVTAMERQGFKVGQRLGLPADNKATYRKIQHRAKLEQISEYRKFLLGFLDDARQAHLDGRDVNPENISLELREVVPRSREASMFRWWNLVWWSMPFQRAYGRQMRFIVWDVGHDAPFGLLQLQSPLLRMKARDDHLEIPPESLDYWANLSMNAQRIGALPPYNDLLGGKMVALAVTANEVRAAYRRRYEGRRTVMDGRVLEPDLLFVTTTSAFGPSSIYDRLKYRGELAAIPIGYTRGSGTFHVPASLTREMYGMLGRIGVDTSTSYGHGPSRKVKLLRDGFARLGLGGFCQHGLKREAYLFPLAGNLRGVIHDGEKPAWVDRPLDEVVEYWLERWAVPRAGRTERWRGFDKGRFFRDAEAMIVGITHK